jgi:Tfp pilus assembly ATPase PilU
MLKTTTENCTMERDEGLKFMYQLLTMMMQKKGSDLFITAGFPPAIKIDGKMTPVTTQPLSPQHTQELARAIMNDKQAAEFERPRNATSPSRRPRSAASASMPWSSAATSPWCCA